MQVGVKKLGTKAMRTGMEEQLVPKHQATIEQSNIARNPTELRSLASHFLELARGEADPQIKQGLSASAYALSQLAECVERRSGAIGG